MPRLDGPLMLQALGCSTRWDTIRSRPFYPACLPVSATTAGTTALGHLVQGVDISGSSENVIGGVAPGAGILITGNSFSGVRFGGSARRNLVQGNLIGTDISGTRALG